MSITVRPALRADCDDLAPRLRREDVDETSAAVGLTPVGVLVAAFYASDMCWAVVIDGLVVALFGVSSDHEDDRQGIPWLLASRDVEDHPRSFLRIGRRYVRLMAVLYQTLRNAVHHKHTQSFTLLEHLGFARAQTLEHFGVHEERFYLYVYV